MTSVKLTIKAYDADGRFIRKRIVRHQLNSDFMGNLYLLMFGTYTAQSGSQAYYTATDINGGSGHIIRVQTNTVDAPFNTTGSSVGTGIQLGTGTTPAARSNYGNTAAIVGLAYLASSAYAAGVLTMSYTITYSTAKNPTEAVLFLECADNVPATAQYNLDHSVFANIGPALTFTLQYQITLD